jgi:hypothetical protein
MITTLPYSTAEIVNAVLPRNATAKGTVERKISQDVYVIALAAGKITVKASSGQLSEGDPVALTSRGNEILIEKIQAQSTGASAASGDTVTVRTAPDSATLKLLADTAADQLKKQVLDKDTLGQLQRVLSAVAKNPQKFGADTKEAIAELKAIVSAMPSDRADVSQTAKELADRIITLGEKFAEKLKGDAGAVDVVLKSGAPAQEGYYSFDNVKSALSWLSQNKEVQENVPWQKLSQVFGDGPVVIKVYESAIGDVRASFVAPERTQDDVSHFIASTLRADMWKSVSGSMLTKVLHDLREIPLQRILEIDNLLQKSEQQTEEPAADAQTDSGASTKGFEAALGQWLTIALDENAPVQQLVSRVPSPSSPQIPALLSTIGRANSGGETTFAKTLKADDFSIQQETFASAQNPDSVLTDLFTRLGLNQEAALLKDNEAAAADVNPQNLKAVLLSLLNSINTASAKSQASAPAAQETVPETAQGPSAPEEQVAPTGTGMPDATETQINASTQNTARSVQLVVASVRSDLDQVFQRLSESAESIRNALSQATQNAGSSGGDTEAVRQIMDKVKTLQDVPAKIDGLVQSLSKNASDDVNRLVLVFQGAGNSFVKAVSAEVSAQFSGEASKAANALEQGRAAVVDAIEKFFVAMTDRVNSKPEETFVPANTATQTDQTEKQLAATIRDVKQEIIAFVKKLPDEIEAMVRKPSEGLQAVQKKLADLMSEAPPDQASAAPGAARSSSNAETQDPVLSQVARNIGIAVKLLDTLGGQATDDSAASALAEAKQELGEVLEDVAQTRVAAEAISPQDNAPSAAVNLSAAQLENLTQAMNDSQAQLVKQSLAGLDKVITRLSQRIEQQPEGGTDSRQEALARALAEIKDGVSDQVDALVRESGKQMMEYATKSAGVLESAAQQAQSLSSFQGKQVDMMQTGNAQTVSRVSAQLDKAAQAVQTAFSRIESAGGDIPGRAEELVRQLQKSIASAADTMLSRTAGVSQEKTSNENPAAATGRQILAKVNDVADRLQDLGRQIQQLQEKVSRDAASLTNRQADLVQNSLKDTLKQLGTLARDVSDQASSASRDTGRRLDDLASQTAKLADRLAGDAGRQEQRGPLDMLKQQVENALTRVESMQVLARQVSVTDGQQQVISLPMKIEGQWTDVVVKFVKKKEEEGKPLSKKPVSVAIHVSPAMLGQIDVFMDYGGKKRFSMRMEFEKPSTRSWFENNKADFSSALARIGFEAFKIDMREIGRKRHRLTSDAALKVGGRDASLAQGMIDITA